MYSNIFMHASFGQLEFNGGIQNTENVVRQARGVLVKWGVGERGGSVGVFVDLLINGNRCFTRQHHIGHC